MQTYGKLYSDISSKIDDTTEKDGNKTTTNRRNGFIKNTAACPYCFEEVGHFSRHLFRKHSKEETIANVLKMPLKSTDRRVAIVALRKKGNFILNQQKNKLKPVRRIKALNLMAKNNFVGNKNDYLPCVNCLGYYKSRYLWRHNKICKAKSADTEIKGNRRGQLTESQTFLVSSGSLGGYLSKSRIKKEVFGIMRGDEISLTAKSDPLICLYGEWNLNKHNGMRVYITSNKMREMARLKLALQDYNTASTPLIDMLKPDMYDNIVAAVKVICGYDPETKTYRASSLALHLGTNLKFLCDIAKTAITIQNPLLPKMEIEERRERQLKILGLKALITERWWDDVCSLQVKVVKEKKFEQPKLLELTEDVQLFNEYVNSIADDAFRELMNSVDIHYNYARLTECTLSLVLLFNRRRTCRVQFLEIDMYDNDISIEDHNSLSEFEKSLTPFLKGVDVLGKKNKSVRVFFTEKMQTFIDLLIEIRKTTDIVPKCNPYIFAPPGSPGRWISGVSIIRKLAKRCGAKVPENLTGTQFREQLATIVQLLSFENTHVDHIARFMGHTENAFMEFYSTSEDANKTAKVVKVILLLNMGRAEFKGKSLDEIEVSEDIVEINEAEDPDAENKVETNTFSTRESVDKNISADPSTDTVSNASNVQNENISITSDKFVNKKKR